MGTYNVPRNLGGETRILVIFTIKSLKTTAIGLAIGLLFFGLLSMLQLKTAGIVILAIFSFIGFVIGRFNVPTIAQIPFTKKIGGMPISESIFRYFKFRKNRKIYIYTKEEK